jgi:hypothetical protein
MFIPNGPWCLLTRWSTDAAVSLDGRFLYVQAGTNGIVDEFAVNPGGSLTQIGSVTVPGAVGGEGIAAT